MGVCCGVSREGECAIGDGKGPGCEIPLVDVDLERSMEARTKKVYCDCKKNFFNQWRECLVGSSPLRCLLQTGTMVLVTCSKTRHCSVP